MVVVRLYIATKKSGLIQGRIKDFWAYKVNQEARACSQNSYLKSTLFIIGFKESKGLNVEKFDGHKVV